MSGCGWVGLKYNVPQHPVCSYHGCLPITSYQHGLYSVRHHQSGFTCGMAALPELLQEKLEWEDMGEMD